MEEVGEEVVRTLKKFAVITNGGYVAAVTTADLITRKEEGAAVVAVEDVEDVEDVVVTIGAEEVEVTAGVAASNFLLTCDGHLQV